MRAQRYTADCNAFHQTAFMNFLAELSSVLVVLANHTQNILETIAIPRRFTCTIQFPTIKKKISFF